MACLQVKLCIAISERFTKCIWYLKSLFKCPGLLYFWANRLQNGSPYAIGPLSCPVCVSVLSVTLVYCDQTVGQIKMKLGTWVGLGPGHTVLDGDPTPPLQKEAPSIFGPCLLWPNGWMEQDATWYGGRPRPRPHCARWDPAPHPQKGAQPSDFRPITIVAKRLDDSRCHVVRR